MSTYFKEWNRVGNIFMRLME